MGTHDSWQPNIATTKAQVSGHRFFLRRIALGLVIGDERLIHDPLTRRNRATIVGLIAVALLLLGSGLLAVVRPQPALGEHSLVQDDYGQLYVHYEQQWHPVANLTSARLLLAEPVEPAPIASSVLAELEMAPPVGIADAPQIFSEGAGPQLKEQSWLGCVAQASYHPRHADAAEAIMVGSAVGSALTYLETGQSVLVPTANGDYVLSMAGKELVRRLLPVASSPEGRLLRERLGITLDTPRWIAPPTIVNLVQEVPAYRWPTGGKIVQQGQRSWYVYGQHAQKLSDFQRELLDSFGEYEVIKIKHTPVEPLVETLVLLPEDPGEFVHTAGESWCVQATPTAASVRGVQDFLGGEELGEIAFDIRLGQLISTPVLTEIGELTQAQPGGTQPVPLHFFHGVTDTLDPSVTRFALSTRGYHIIAESGVRHRISNLETISVLGVSNATIVPWELLQLLPQGTVLTQEAAAQRPGGGRNVNM
ncbi:MAG: type VII secretion protein EccB [Corynebacterium sp.]|nr:type VII secretion protein EccB [Corynebacterium sp.]